MLSEIAITSVHIQIGVAVENSSHHLLALYLQHAGFNHNFSNVISKVISYPIEMIFTPLASIFHTDFKYVSLIAALHRDHMLRPFKHASR